MDLNKARELRELLEGTSWLERTDEFGRALRVSTKSSGGLLLFGPPEDEPWHLTAHLDDEARYANLPELTPTLVRWNPPPGAPPHLSIGLERLRAAARGESLLVVAPSTPVPLLERLDDVRRKGARIFALGNGESELASIAHEMLTVDSDALPVVSFDSAQHLVSIAATSPHEMSRRSGLRARLGRLLDRIVGPGG